MVSKDALYFLFLFIATQKPEIAKCFMEAIAANGDIRQSKFSGTSECKNQQDFYGRFQVDHFKTNLTYSYTVAIDKGLLQPGFVKSYVFGITDGDVQIIKINLTGILLSVCSRDNLSSKYINKRNKFLPSNAVI